MVKYNAIIILVLANVCTGQNQFDARIGWGEAKDVVILYGNLPRQYDQFLVLRDSMTTIRNLFDTNDYFFCLYGFNGNDITRYSARELTTSKIDKQRQANFFLDSPRADIVGDSICVGFAIGNDPDMKIRFILGRIDMSMNRIDVSKSVRLTFRKSASGWCSLFVRLFDANNTQIGNMQEHLVFCPKIESEIDLEPPKRPRLSR